MPRPSKRSRTLRRVHVRTPGGKTTMQYRKRKPSRPKCASCKKPLAGVPRERPYKMQRMARTTKRPERPHGGKLCSACMRKVMVAKARAKKE